MTYLFYIMAVDALTMQGALVTMLFTILNRIYSVPDP